MTKKVLMVLISLATVSAFAAKQKGTFIHVTSCGDLTQKVPAGISAAIFELSAGKISTLLYAQETEVNNQLNALQGKVVCVKGLADKKMTRINVESVTEANN